MRLALGPALEAPDVDGCDVVIVSIDLDHHHLRVGLELDDGEAAVLTLPATAVDARVLALLGDAHAAAA